MQSSVRCRQSAEQLGSFQWKRLTAQVNFTHRSPESAGLQIESTLINSFLSLRFLLKFQIVCLFSERLCSSTVFVSMRRRMHKRVFFGSTVIRIEFSGNREYSTNRSHCVYLGLRLKWTLSTGVKVSRFESEISH